MTELGDDCFACDGEPLSVAAALDLLRRQAVPLPAIETVPLAAAYGRILAAPVVAPRNLPPYDNAAVDGYAVSFDDLRPDQPSLLPVGGRAAAGHPLGRPARHGEAIRVFTGAPLPEGTDTVLMQEACTETAEGVGLPPGIARGANRRRAGEDVAAGATALAPGRRLRPQEIGLAAALGRTDLAVYRRLRVAVLSTGDEVREPGTPLPPGTIYDANRYMLLSLLDGLGCAVRDLGILPDSAAAIRAALAEAGRDHELVVTSGGMSAGEEDHVRTAVEAEGRLHFWRLAIKPGRPVAMGRIGRAPFIGLPGNPVAVMVTFLLLGRPLVLRLAGAAETTPRAYRVVSGFDYAKKPGRSEYLRARLVRGADGTWTAQKFPRDGSGILSSLVEADGLVALDDDLSRVAIGDPVDFLPFRELLS